MDKLAVVLTPRQEYMRRWRANNQDRIKATRKAWYEANRDSEIEKSLRWTRENREADRAKSKKFRSTHPEYNKSYSRKYYWEKQRNDIQFRLKSTLRARLGKALRHNLKTGSAVRELGCSIDELRTYLELKFVDNMSWDNWGEWHIDHIKPLATFDLTDIEQFRAAVHYTNLQPLWAEENLRKGKRG